MTSPTTTTTTTPAPAETVDALQKALTAEHAAIWVYGLVSAFLPASFNTAINEGSTAHRARRDTTERRLAAAGATPQVAEPAYALPKPVTDQASSLALLATAEADTSAAWRAVLERTDDGTVREAALEALTASAVRATRWRKQAGVSPATPPMPGQP